jgi:hypothetical protein
MIRKIFSFISFLAVLAVATPGLAQFASEGCSAEVVASCPACATCDAQRVLDGMDTRAPVPLLPMMAEHQKRNMRDHLLAVQEIIAAMAGDDFAAIERSAGRIGYSEQMGQMCAHMGAGAPGFTDKALEFHRTADTIAVAAKAQDRAGVLKALGATLQTCTGCHATFRQQIVDDATWNRITGTPAPSTHP